MRIVRLHETVPQLGSIHLHHLTDLHTGAPDFDQEAFLERRALIEQDPQARWTMGGDAGDLIRHGDRRYSPTELDPRYRLATDIRQASKEHLLELFAPIAGKCWGWCDGNHERAMDTYNGGKFGVELCCELGIEDKWVGYRGFVHIVVTIKGRTARLPLLVDLQHGWQVGRLKGAPHVQAEREFSTTDADVLLRGHNHQPAAHTFVTLGVTTPGRGGQRNATRRYRTMLNGGTWRRGYRDNLEDVNPRKLSEVEGDLWGETKGFRAEPLGGPVLRFRFDSGRGNSDGPGRSASVQHTTIEGEIDALALGLAA